MPKTTKFKTVWWSDKQLIGNSIPEISDGIMLVNKEDPMHVEFLCPCGCGVLIRIFPSDETIQRTWTFSDDNGSPTINPSINCVGQNCKSHFFIRQGEVHWC